METLLNTTLVKETLTRLAIDYLNHHGLCWWRCVLIILQERRLHWPVRVCVRVCRCDCPALYCDSRCHPLSRALRGDVPRLPRWPRQRIPWELVSIRRVPVSLLRGLLRESIDLHCSSGKPLRTLSLTCCIATCKSHVTLFECCTDLMIGYMIFVR